MPQADDQRQFVEEPARQTPVRARADVLVVGSGAAGLIAALAAARNGARTILVERYGYLGGQLTGEYSTIPGSGTLGMGFQGAHGQRIVGGIAWELMQRLIAQGGAIGPLERTVISSVPGGFLDAPYGRLGPKFDPETLKTVALEMVQEAGIQLLLHSLAVEAIKQGDTVAGVIVQSKSGRQAILAHTTVDASADADIAVAAGAPWAMVPKDELYHMGMELTLANVDTGRAYAYIKQHPEQFSWVILPADESQVPAGLQKPLRAAAVMSESGRFQLSDDRRAVTGKSRINVKIGIRPGISFVAAGPDGDATDVADLTQAEIDGRQKSLRNIAWLREHIPGFEHCFVVAQFPLGVRESRRIVGDYVLTEEDLRQGRRFDDAIGQNNMPLDCHKPGGAWSFDLLAAPHDIPYRCLLPAGVENLLVAGRCISMDHVALSSLRKVPSCMVTGQAAGTAAALAARAGLTPRQLAVATLQATLSSQGALLGREKAPEYV